MKIALFVPSWPPGLLANGIVTYASQLVPALRRLGHEVYVLTPLRGAGDDDPQTIDLQPYFLKTTLWDRLMFKLSPDTHFFNRASAAITSPLWELVQSEKLDVFEMEESVGCSLAVSRLHLLPVIVRLHGPWFLTAQASGVDDRRPDYRRRLWREGKGIQHAQFVTSPSRKVLHMVENHYGFNLTNSRVIFNPLQAASDSDTWRVNTCNKDNVLFIGRFDTLKGGDLVLRAFADLASRNHKLSLTFVGPDTGLRGADGTTWNFEHFIRSSLPDFCRSRINFRGEVGSSLIPSIRRSSFVTVISSRQELMPYSILEAMSLGCPIVATAVGGVPELIKDGINGLLVPPENEKAIATACQRLFDDHGMAARLGYRAWKDCREYHNPEYIARESVSVYEEAVNNFKKRARRTRSIADFEFWDQ